jgi:hypothetical protein
MGVLCFRTNRLEIVTKTEPLPVTSEVQIYPSLGGAASLEIERSLLSTRVSQQNVTKPELREISDIMYLHRGNFEWTYGERSQYTD